MIVDLLRTAPALVGGAGCLWRDHRRAAKKRARAIQFTRGRPRRPQLYRELNNLTRATLACLQRVMMRLASATDLAVALWQTKAKSERRVVAGESVPVGDKLVSLFELHADIIVKGSREVHSLLSYAQPDHGQERLDPRSDD